MIHFKFTKILAVILAANLLIEPVPTQMQAEETFRNIHDLYQYWCSNDYENFPENVGDVYCYYYNDSLSSPSYDPKKGIEYGTTFDGAAQYKETQIYSSYSDMPVSSSAIGNEKAIIVNNEKTEDIIEVSADENYDLVIGLTENTKEAQQEILTKLQDKNHVAFASCKYSHSEIQKVHKEIFQMMTEDTGICGIGSTCNVTEPDSNHKFSVMENYVDVSILPEFYEKTAIILKEMYGDKVKTSQGTMTVNDSAADCTNDKMEEEKNGIGVDIGIGGTKEQGIKSKPAYTDGIDSTVSNQNFQFRHTTKALTVKDTFTFQGNWKKTAEVTWKVTGKKKVNVISKKKNGCNFKIQAKKAGYITITAKNKKNKKTISEKVLILDKEGTVSSQKKLMEALQSETVKKITIKTEENKKFTIPKGEYGNKKIIINAPKSEITIEEENILEHIVWKKSKQVRIMGITREKAKQIFGEPTDSLSGMDGDIFKIENKIDVIAYYDLDAQTEIGNGTIQTMDRPAEIKEMPKISEEEIATFYGTILEIYENGISALVAPDRDSAIYASGDQVSVNLAINTTDNFFVGDRVEVKYYGGVMETFPLQINELEVNKVM